jgi:hypothetical protein
MAMAMAKKQKSGFWRELRHKSGCYRFGWAVYAPWACYMNLRALYVSKLAKCPLICLADLAGDLRFEFKFQFQLKLKLKSPRSKSKSKPKPKPTPKPTP